jgi:predicted deacylase
MANPPWKKSHDLSQLPVGFHRRRFTASGGVGFDAFIWRGGPGPVLLVNGATHGDEYEGPTLLRTWAEQWRPGRLAGTVVFVPVLNEAAFFAGQRCAPVDGANLARVFPGKPKGSPTERLAHLFDTHLLAQCTHYADLHSAGAAYHLKPWTGYVTHRGAINRAQRAMAACFDAFWVWAGPYLPGRTLSAAFARNIPAIYVECQGLGGVDAGDLRNLDRGLRNLLRWAGLTPGAAPRLRRQKVRITRDVDEAHLQVHHPAPVDGLFVPIAALDRRVRRGARIGRVLPLDGSSAREVHAESTGRIILIRRQRSVRRGDALFTLAPV